MNSFNAPPGALWSDRENVDDGPQSFTDGKCRTEGCESRSESYCATCIEAHERRMLGPADALRRQQRRRGAA